MLDGRGADSRTGRNRIRTASNFPIIHITGLVVARMSVGALERETEKLKPYQCDLVGRR